MSLRPLMLQTAMRARGSAVRSAPLSTLSLAHRLPLSLTRSTSPIISSILKTHSSPFSTSRHAQEASKVSMKPASENLEHVGVNIKEEASGMAKTLAKGIAGGEDVSSITRTTAAGHGSSTEGELKESFLSVTKGVALTVPRHIFVFGLAGGLPYLGASLTTLYVARQASMAASGTAMTDITTATALLDTCQHFQVTYGAVLLSFLGAIHWGMEFSKFGGYQGYSRLTLGVLPLLGAWPTLAMEPQMALVSQWFLFTLLWVADMKATTAGWAPPWYSQYRFYLSILVGTCILGTLFGINYLGPTTDVALATNMKETGVLGSSLGYMEHIVKADFEKVNADQKKGTAGGKDKQFWTEQGEDGFVKIMKKKDDEEEEGEGEEGASDSEGDDSEKKDGEDEGKSDSDSDEPKGDDAKKSENAGKETGQKNEKAGATGENMESAVKTHEEGIVQTRGGASKKDKNKVDKDPKDQP